MPVVLLGMDDKQVRQAGDAVQAVRGRDHHVVFRTQEVLAAVGGQPVERDEVVAGNL